MRGRDSRGWVYPRQGIQELGFSRGSVGGANLNRVKWKRTPKNIFYSINLPTAQEFANNLIPFNCGLSRFKAYALL